MILTFGKNKKHRYLTGFINAFAFFSIFYGCTDSCNPEVRGNKDTDGIYAKKKTDLTKTQVFILPGLRTDPKSPEIQGIIGKLPSISAGDAQQSAGPYHVPTSVSAEKTFSKGITEQADLIAMEIRNTLQKSFPNKDEYKNIPIILISHSQGGLRGYAIIMKYLEEFNIIGLIAIASPLQGAPAVKTLESGFDDFFKKYVLESPKYESSGPSDKFKTWINTQPGTAYMKPRIEKIMKSFIPAGQPGVADMIPGSTFLSNMASSLSKNEVPIMLICGKVDNFNAADVSIKGQKLEADMKTAAGVGYSDIGGYEDLLKVLSPVLAEIGTKDMGTDYDAVVPLRSQSLEDVKDKKNVEVHIIDNVNHGSILASKDTLSYIADFVKRIVLDPLQNKLEILSGTKKKKEAGKEEKPGNGVDVK